MVPLPDSAIREMEQRGELLPRDIHNCVRALCFVLTPALSAAGAAIRSSVSIPDHKAFSS